MTEAKLEGLERMDENLGKIKSFFQNVGSNLTLAGRQTRCEWEKPFAILSDFNRNLSWWSLLDEIRTYYLENTLQNSKKS